MAIIDSRIVSIKFDNRDFMSATAATIGALQKLKNAAGMKEAQVEADKFNMNSVESSTQKVSASFAAMATIAITALSNITNRAIDAGISITKSLSLDQVTAGFKEYELKMGAIQTIMAGSGESLEVVNRKLEELNAYADKTIYSFADMTQNIGKFTNAGLSLDVSVAAIQGVANVAALSGANANEASRAMYNFAQALSKGHVQLMDWKSIELANMGTKEFKQQLIDAGVAMGTLTKTTEGYVTMSGSVVSATKGFNESLTDQWLTTEVLTTTLGNYADETTEIGKRAFAAAQDVKTFSQLMATLKESVGSGFARSFEIIIGDFEEAKTLFTDINAALSGFVERTADARNNLLQGWSDLGGRAAAIEGFKNAFSALGDIIGAVGDAFRNVFPAATSERLAEMSKSFRDFTEQLKPSEKALENLERVLTGVFSIFSIGAKVIKAVAGFLMDLVGVIFSGIGSFGSFAAVVGDFFTGLNEGIPSFELFGGLLDGVRDGVFRLSEAFTHFAEFVTPAITAIKDFAVAMVGDLAGAIGDIDWNAVFGGIASGSLAAIALSLRKGIKGELGIDFGGGFISELKNSLSALTGVLEGMQTNLKADALLKIAGAIAILAASLVVMSTIDPGRLATAMTGVAAGMSALMGAMVILTKMGGMKGVVGLPLLASGLVLLASAMLILSASMKVLAGLSWGELAKGLVGVAGGLGLLIGAVKLLSGGAKGMLRVGFNLMVLSTALVIMAEAVEKFGGLSLGDLAKGLTGVATSLLILAGAIKIMPKGMVLQAVGLVIIANSLVILANAVEKFGGLKLSEIGKGLLAIASSLAILAGVMRLMPKNMFVTAAGLVVLSIALGQIADVVQDFGGMSVEEIAKGLITLAGALGIIVGALTFIQAGLVGAAAMIVIAASISILAGALKLMGTMDWGEIGRSLVALAAGLTVLGVAAAVFGLASPLLLAGGAALVVFGAGLALVATAAFLFATAIEVASAAAANGTENITTMLENIVRMIPDAAKAFAEGFVEFALVLAESAPKLIAAFSAILGAMLQAGIDNIPLFGELFRKIMEEILKTVPEYFPQMLKLGFDMMIEFMSGISQNMPEIIRKGADIIVAFIKGIGDEMPRILRAGTDTIIAFIKGIASNMSRIADEGMRTIIVFVNSVTASINKYAPQLRAAGKDLGVAIIDGMTGGIASKVGSLVNAAKGAAQSAVQAAKNVLGISSPSKAFMYIGKQSGLGMVIGLSNTGGLIAKASEKVGDTALTSLQESMRGLSALIFEGLDARPVITPVMDLSQVSKEVSVMNKMLGNSTISAGVSYSQASSISAEKTEAFDGKIAETGTTKVEFVQNNYSPEALSTIEIYRNTRNQLSLAKGALVA
jgi:tape measure domain-containing protein